MGWVERREVQHLKSFVYIPTLRTKDLFLDVKRRPLHGVVLALRASKHLALMSYVLINTHGPHPLVTILDVIDLTDTGRVKNNGESHRTAE